jgi:transcriptional regulator with XRE-family HTH domain
MKLSEWLSSNSISDTEFAEKIGVSRQALYRYKQGTRVPKPKIVLEIAKATDGQVSANDFYETAA